MTTKYKSIIKGLCLTLCFCCSAVGYAGNVAVKAKMDSSAIWMGQQTRIHLEVVQDKNKTVYPVALADTLVSGVEILFASKPDTTIINDNRIQINRDLIITSFDSGFYYIPPFRYVLDSDTFETQPLSLKVVPVEVDTTKAEMGIKGVQAPPFDLWDYLPDRAYVIAFLILLLIIDLIFLYWRMRKKKEGAEKIDPEDLLPPHEKALKALEQLKEEKLWQSGMEKQYYTQITDILREYIDKRFGINAMEMTSSEILHLLKKKEEARSVYNELQLILEVSDFVKFAKMRPAPDENEKSMRDAADFIVCTKEKEKPLSEVEEKETEKSQKQKDKE